MESFGSIDEHTVKNNETRDKIGELGLHSKVIEQEMERRLHSVWSDGSCVEIRCQETNIGDWES
jgi:hypothetical protein